MISRRNFLKTLLSFLIAFFFSPRKLLSVSTTPPAGNVISVAQGKNKSELIQAALHPLGGIERWIQKGSSVVIKPNAAWSRLPEEAANVHPELLESLIGMCYKAGARTVQVIDHTCDNPLSALKVNQIKAAVSGTKAKLHALGDEKDFVTIDVPRGKKLKKVDVAKEIIEADVFINMPIAKVHGAATLTVGMKNHMGAIKDRWFFHTHGLHQCIADVSTVLQPDLIVVDATRLLLTNGPKGPGKVRIEDKVIVGTDQVAVDSYAATLFGYRGADIDHIQKAYELGLGEIDLEKITIKTSNV
ncbi:MAG: DUF362 domain-containing protein [Candidatus Omnitrophica bacterium]|nr:DUF362 domain-containing protein [Candidatus Omnitrophota bacterium]